LGRIRHAAFQRGIVALHLFISPSIGIPPIAAVSRPASINVFHAFQRRGALQKQGLIVGLVTVHPLEYSRFGFRYLQCALPPSMFGLV
jgi:hypothetical protein